MRVEHWQTRAFAVVALAVLVTLSVGCDETSSQYTEGENGKMSVTPTSIIFPQIAIDEVESRIIRIRNVGTGTLRIPFNGGYTLSPADQPFLFTYMQVNGQDTETLEAGAEAELVVTYRAADDQMHYAELHIEATNSDKATITLSTVTPTPQIQVDPNPILFSRVRPNTSTQLEATVSNVGTAPLSIKKITFAAGNTTDFTILSQLPATPLSLAPDESFPILLGYTPTGDVNLVDVSHLLFDSNSGATDHRLDVEIKGTISSPRIEIAPASLDFGAAETGEIVKRSLSIENIGEEPLEVSQVYLDLSSSKDFSYNDVDSFTLQPDEIRGVDVFYQASGQGVDSGYLVFESNDPISPAVSISLLGMWAGPDMDVRPTQLDFGQVAINVSKSLSFEIYNVGVRDLTIHEIPQLNGPTDGSLTLQVEGGLGFPLTIPGNSKKKVSLLFSPKSEFPSTVVTFEVRSNDPVEPNVRVSARMEGVGAGFCEVELVPVTLNFGLVPGGYDKQLPIMVRNKGAAPCQVQAVTLRTDMTSMFYGNPFSFVVPFTPFEVGPGESHLLEFNYRPLSGSEIDTFGSQAIFVVNDPLNGLNNIACASAPTGLPGMGGCSFGFGLPGNCWACLTGKTGDPALAMVPSIIDFGLVTLGCNSQTIRARIYNKGTAPTNLISVELDATCAANFSLQGVPPMPYSLAAGTFEEVELIFTPVNTTPESCRLIVKGDTETLTVPVKGTGTTDENVVDNFRQVSGRKVDVLFVVDNSGSMGDDQQNLADNFTSFIGEALTWGVDFQIGVTTTDDAHEGKLQAQGSYPRIIASSEMTAAQVEAAFKGNIKVGDSGSATERGLKAAELALTNPNVTSNVPGDCPGSPGYSDECSTPYSCDTHDQSCGGYNAGFLRDDASLEIIFVTDEQDQSPAVLDYYVDTFKNIKGYQNSSMMHAHAIVGYQDTNGQCSMSGFERYTDVADQTNGEVASLCGDFANSLSVVGSNAFGLRQQFFLSRVPVQATIKVSINGVEQSSGWVFDPASNSIVFDDASVPPNNANLVINYKAACF
ncbi:MAG: choice-of-anchor D domain-containing protein [Myxococcota bacterium]|jgi:hypothetical protein|nr:choice-of-anchor D domain-containing protein [Myxococcota bacterium]